MLDRRLSQLIASSTLLLVACAAGTAPSGGSTQSSGSAGKGGAGGTASTGAGAGGATPSASSGSSGLGGASQGSSSGSSGAGGPSSSSGSSSGSTSSSGSGGPGGASPSSSSGSGASGASVSSSSGSGGGASSSSSGGTTTFGTACGSTPTQLTGTVYAPNGIDPIPNVRVYAAISINPYPANYCDKCSAPIDPAYTNTYTAADGTFTLDLASVPQGATITFAIQIGRFRKWTALPVTACQTQAVPVAAETLPGASSANSNIPKIAVSAGTVDHLDTVLANLGITQYDCYEGRPSRNYPYGGSCPGLGATSKTIADVLVDPTQFGANGAYNMAFLSCAPGGYAAYVTPAIQATVTSNTQAWVANGGRIFVTDTAYDYVAQPFPAGITWAGPAGTPQPVDKANVGCAPGTSPHTVLYPLTVDDPTLAAWLKLPQIGFPNSPNVTVNGFYEPWSAIASLPTTTKLIANGPMMPIDPTLTGNTCSAAATQIQNVPLTAQFDVPTCGRVIFSSYHTYNSTGSTAANEKIMEFLIFAAAVCRS